MPGLRCVKMMEKQVRDTRMFCLLSHFSFLYCNVFLLSGKTLKNPNHARSNQNFPVYFWTEESRDKSNHSDWFFRGQNFENGNGY